MAQKPVLHVETLSKQLDRLELAVIGLILTLQRRHDLPELDAVLLDLDRNRKEFSAAAA